MAHVDAETLHAWLDGSLAGERRQAVQAHVAACAQCAAHLAATRRVLDEATRIAAAVRGEGAAGATSHPPPPEPPRSPPGPPQSGFSEPVVLMPPPPESASYPRRPRRRRGLVTAAVIVLGFGAGFGMMRARVVRPINEQAQDLGSLTDTPRYHPPVAAAPVPAPAPVTPPMAPRPADDTVSRVELAARPPVATDSAPARARERTPPAVQQTPPPEPKPQPAKRPAPDGSAVERQNRLAAAAAATEELDRRLVRERAAEATARIDRLRPPVPPADTTPAKPEPEPYSIDREAGLTRRLGLDEVEKHLGEPMHVIDGLRPEVVGLVDGANVAGADDTRPVVRVVYRTPAGGLVMLDQQRVRTLAGDRPELSGPQGGRRWIRGEVLIYLHGRASPAELSDLASRVR